MIDTKQLAALADAATPGPWVNTGRYIGIERHRSLVGECRDVNGCWSDSSPASQNAAFISAANPAAIKELCQRVEQAEEFVAKHKPYPSWVEVAKERDQLKADLAEAYRALVYHYDQYGTKFDVLGKARAFVEGK